MHIEDSRQSRTHHEHCQQTRQTRPPRGWFHQRCREPLSHTVPNLSLASESRQANASQLVRSEERRVVFRSQQTRQTLPPRGWFHQRCREPLSHTVPNLSLASESRQANASQLV